MRIFVYGTLLSGYGNNYHLSGQEYLGEIETEPKYTLVDCGGFPGLVKDGETPIVGEIYEVDEECILQLDYLEGHVRSNPSASLFKPIEVELADGTTATTYSFNRLSEEAVILSGSWRDFVGEGSGHNYCG